MEYTAGVVLVICFRLIGGSKSVKSQREYGYYTILILLSVGHEDII